MRSRAEYRLHRAEISVFSPCLKHEVSQYLPEEILMRRGSLQIVAPALFGSVGSMRKRRLWTRIELLRLLILPWAGF